jgi:tubulin polyglutamylase TTLL4
MEKSEKEKYSSSHGSDSGSSDDDDSDMSYEEKEELVPRRPELENVESQTISLLIPPSSGPKHPRTVFFINDPELNSNPPLDKKYKVIDVEITEKKFMFLYKAYKNLPLCLSGPMKYNHVIRSKLFDNTNIVWKLMKKDRMFPYLQTLHKYQKFNHFPMTWQLSRKDNLYNNFMNMKNKFPNDFKYMPETYIMPRDYDIFVNEKLKNFDLNDKTHLWLLKPVASSRGRGIRLLTDIENIPKKILAAHYIYNPHLINGRKYDLRLYLLVTGYTPLKIYLFDNGLARFCSEEYDLNPEKMQDRYIHLTNYSINKTSLNFEQNDSVTDEFGDKWTLFTLRNYFKKNNLDFDKVWEKIKDIIVK